MDRTPISFTNPMVLAINADRKTVTRRMVNPQPPASAPRDIKCHWLDDDRYGFFAEDGDDFVCRYRPGQICWIKTSYTTRYDEQFNCTCWCVPGIRFFDTRGRALSKTGRAKRDGGHPAMFMPEWLSQEMRLPLLEIVDVRFERLQAITEEDAIREGCDGSYLNNDGMRCDQQGVRAGLQYQHLWESINGPGSWNLNPWVWRIEFRKVDP